jgi:SAM-dependent methyltransferase
VTETLREIWDAQSSEWARWVRTPAHDRANQELNVPALVELLPPPGRATLDVGCGEGRFGRVLTGLGHRVVGVDASPAMVALAVETQDAVVADAAALPFADGGVRPRHEDAGLAIEALREVLLPPAVWRDEASARWARIPSFLHVRAVKR